MYCIHCGREIELGRFCPYCGAETDLGSEEGDLTGKLAPDYPTMPAQAPLAPQDQATAPLREPLPAQPIRPVRPTQPVQPTIPTREPNLAGQRRSGGNIYYVKVYIVGGTQIEPSITYPEGTTASDAVVEQIVPEFGLLD